MKRHLIKSSICLLTGILGTPALAVIVGGPNGDGLGNATEPALQSDLNNRSLPTFPFWNHLLQVSDSSGIYLGRNATTGRGWVMTATHVTELTVDVDTITVLGQTYTVRENQIIKHPDANGTLPTDIRLYAIGGNPGDPALPEVTSIPLLPSNVLASENLILTGRGRRQQSPEDTIAPYAWDWTYSTREIRWGSNHVEMWSEKAPHLIFLINEGNPDITKKTSCFACLFDDPAGTGTPSEGQLAWLDSGGGVFVKRSGSWYLAGTNYAVEDGIDGDSVADPAGFGDVSIMTHLPSYRVQIETITGPLVPANSGPLNDLDGDGITNLTEYALNLDPLSNQQEIMIPITGLKGLPFIHWENQAGADRLTMEFVRRTTNSGSGLTYIPQVSSNLVDWQTLETEVSVTSINSSWDRVKVADTETLNSEPYRFGRLKVTVED